jgi:ribosome-associated toxin RatA of RatAB toxin-antitoxin module
MPRVHRSALLPYQPEQMFDLVNDVAAYPAFVPWCVRAEVLSATDRETVAALTLGKGPVLERFVTRNTLYHPDRITLDLEHGPFRHLRGTWHFVRLGEAGCKIELEMDFELAHKVWRRMFGALFSSVVDSLVDSFCERARALYGPARGNAPGRN